MTISRTIKASVSVVCISAATNSFAQSDPKFDYLPEVQAQAMQRVIEGGARLTPYDKQFLFWAALNLVNPNCGIVSVQEGKDLELMLTEAATASLFADPFSSVQAQLDFAKHALSLADTGGPCHSEDGKRLLGEIVTVLKEDNRGSRSDFFEYLQELEILPKQNELDQMQRGPQTASLHKTQVLPFGRYNIDLLCVPGANDGTEQVCDKVLALIGSGTAQTLKCTYGPFSADGSGFQVYEFWYNSAPENLETYAVSGRQHPFYRLGSTAVRECPSDNDTAVQFHKENRL